MYPITTSSSSSLPTEPSALSAYLAQIKKFPILSFEEEQRLAKLWSETGDMSAAERLVTSHLRLVAKIAMSYRGYGLPVADLISEGNFGLIQAVKRFDHTRGFRLATYAMWWIRAAIQEYVLRSWSIVKIGTTAAQKKLFFRLRRTKEQLQLFEPNQLSEAKVDEIADMLGVSANDVVSMNQRMSSSDQSLNAPVGENSTEQWQELLVDEKATQDEVVQDQDELDKRRQQLAKALKSLKPREYDIITRRWLQDKPETLNEISEEYGVTRERIRQIEQRALGKLSNLVQLEAPDTKNTGLIVA